MKSKCFILLLGNQCILIWITIFTVELVFSAIVMDNIITRGKDKYFKPD